MKIYEIRIINYKSLANITLKPTDLSAIIGPNASGKSNLASALNFLSEVYLYNLETAIKRNGGYEHIALRRITRSRSAIEFSVSIIINLKTQKNKKFFSKSEKLKENEVLVTHGFSFKAIGREIKSTYNINYELLSISKKIKGEWVVVNSILRNSVNKIKLSYKVKNRISNELNFIASFYKNNYKIFKQQELFINQFKYLSLNSLITEAISHWNIFQFSSQSIKQSGVPTPNPTLIRTGENLPALIDWLKNNNKKEWNIVMSTMHEIVGSISEITVEYTSNQQLGIFFTEEGFGRPWSTEDISDGTILSLAILCVAADPRSTLILIEELENSLHPWIQRVLIESFRKLSSGKNIILTTHSPVLIDLLRPDEVWILNRVKTDSQLNKLTDLATDLESNWKEGKYKISEYLDTGLIPQAVPLYKG